MRVAGREIDALMKLSDNKIAHLNTQIFQHCRDFEM